MIVDLGFWMRKRSIVLTFELLCFLVLGVTCISRGVQGVRVVGQGRV